MYSKGTTPVKMDKSPSQKNTKRKKNSSQTFPAKKRKKSKHTPQLPKFLPHHKIGEFLRMNTNSKHNESPTMDMAVKHKVDKKGAALLRDLQKVVEKAQKSARHINPKNVAQKNLLKVAQATFKSLHQA